MAISSKTTFRSASTSAGLTIEEVIKSQITSTANGRSLSITRAWKQVNLAWMNDFDDNLRICVLTFHGVLPEHNNFYIPENTEGDVQLFGEKRTKKSEIEKAERDPLFKFNILKRFQGKCLITNLVS